MECNLHEFNGFVGLRSIAQRAAGVRRTSRGHVSSICRYSNWRRAN